MRLIREIYSIRPYKLKELEPEIWVYDIENEACRQVARINEYGGIFWHGALCEYEADKFKEGRFFPVIKAMYQ